jgi:hypothetical protein
MRDSPQSGVDEPDRRQDNQVRHLFFQPGFGRLEAATALRKHAGPTVATDLLATLPDFLDDDLTDRWR